MQDSRRKKKRDVDLSRVKRTDWVAQQIDKEKGEDDVEWLQNCQVQQEAERLAAKAVVCS